MTKVVQWKKGSRVTGDAEKIHSELEVIRKKSGDITPQEVVEKARSKRSSMHRSFEWDDSVAGEKYRDEQARKLIRSIEVIIIEAPDVPAPAYSVVTRPSKGEAEPRSVYQSTEEALKNPIQRDEILGRAIREAISYRRKYASLQELSKVIKAVDELVENFGG